MAVEARYFCNGTDQAVVTQEQYNQGLTKCGNESCSLHGQPFEKGLYCTTCGRKITTQEESQHNH